MQKDLHPKAVPCKIIYQGQVVMETMSTRPEIHVDVWSGVHPFWTGEERFLDTEGRVDKFNKRFGDSYRRGSKKYTASFARRLTRTVGRFLLGAAEFAKRGGEPSWAASPS